MTLETVLLIGFSGIIIGVILLLFSDDKKISNIIPRVSAVREIIKTTIATISTKLNSCCSPNEPRIQLRITYLIIDLLIGTFTLYLQNGLNLYEIGFFKYSVLPCMLAIPLLLFRRSWGQMILHIKVYNFNGSYFNHPILSVLRYILKIILLPISFFSILMLGTFAEDVIFKTYEEEEYQD